MSKFIPDISNYRWVIISPGRTSRPDNFEQPKAPVCPFCPGNEGDPEDEVLRIKTDDGKGWKLRIIKNKYPVTDFHEVVIHSPDEKELDMQSVDDVELIFKSYQKRYNFYKDKGNVLIFCNQGEHSGASIKHPHSQIIVTPPEITLNTLPIEPVNNVVFETKFFTVYCPDYSQWPYEVWIAPIKDGVTFGEAKQEEVRDLATVLQIMIKKLRYIYKNRTFSMLPFAYNYYIYPKDHWYVRIIPRFIHKGGFELGSRLDINIVDPVKAAMDLKHEEHMVYVLNKLKDGSSTEQ
jgi:UDPglucose--hexose-1-phosphate uridylyltransferase